MSDTETLAPISPGADAIERLLADLNPPQRKAVEHGEGPLLVIAGAGSGKTRVLTRRVAYLVATGQARPSEILAITFTNKAAQEMRERVEELVGGVSKLMWVMTFHSACARILRANAERLGYKRSFTIYDEADSLRMLKRCMEECEIDPKRFTPRSIRAAISGAKNRLEDSTDYAERQASFFEEQVADAYALYERRMVEASAMDFDDLLVRTVNLLELFADVRERYERTFRWILVDEYQDTNKAQYRLLQLLAGDTRNLTVVGDDAQCLVEGTEISMGDGSIKPIEQVQAGDQVLSNLGSGKLAPMTVDSVHRSTSEELIRITTESGSSITSTPEHTHFAGFRAGVTPQVFMTYVMRRAGRGFRVGITRTQSVRRRGRPILGLAERTRMEHADAAWIIDTHPSECEARACEAELAARYALPVIPFVARNGSRNSVVGNQSLIDRVFERVDSDEGGYRLLRDRGLAHDAPHYQPSSYEGRRRIVNLTLCGQSRGGQPMHVVSVGGRDPSVKAALEEAGLSVRPAKNGSKSWRFESCCADYGEAQRLVERIQEATAVSVRRMARLGRNTDLPGASASLSFMPAASVRSGMAMFTAEGGYDVVDRVERIRTKTRVYDLDVRRTHNFIANGLATHNSIYSFRSADVRNILGFERDFEGAEVIKLEQNYRSTGTILDAANAVIANNTAQKPKSLWTDEGKGDLVTVAEVDDEHGEARFVAGEIERLVSDEGYARDDVAVFYRMNAQSRVLEDTLVRYEMPYQVIGGTKFYERAEVKDAIAYLQLLANPADGISFGRVVNSPRRGIGQQTQARVLSHANTTGEDIWDVMARPHEIPSLGTAAVKALSRFAAIMAGLRERAEGESVAELLESVLHDTGYMESLEAERTLEAEGRIENLQELVGVAREFDANRVVEGPSEDTPLEEFLARISLYTDQDSLRDSESLITLMTLHNAKGLEYDAVFMIGCEEGVFPHSRSVEEGNLEEERRLAYVGVTRARKRLYMTCARRRMLHGAGGWNLPSRFLREVPEDLVDHRAMAMRTGWQTADSRQQGMRVGGGFSPPAPKQPHEPEAEFRIGDDVIHASFGEGVVTSVEPGAVIVVRFASEGAERKLMADYAPLKKAS